MLIMSLRERLAVLIVAVCLLGVLVVGVSEGATVGLGLLGLVDLGLITLLSVLWLAVELTEDEGRFRPGRLLFFLVILAVSCYASYLTRLKGTDADVTHWFPLTNFSVLTVIGPGFVAVLVVGFLVEQGWRHLKPRVVALRHRMSWGTSEEAGKG